ncbi:alpha/beta-hydrolase [Cristinia sonorae]|uniref:Alpha/beta-hydrolase n=1 Tax=Cristinia sonorae TaxID=1940300 RepID=A0A8K0XLY1_9AGAR|nr:alpha/beta-hydrolase [Cristinia sonorae]
MRSWIFILSPFLLLISQTTATKPTGTPHYREYFYIGGRYVQQPATPPNGPQQLLADGQIYVEHLTPAAGVTKLYPLLMIHGAGMTATNFLNTPDGRMGWADWFLGQGYEVYLVDQPSRGRSPWLQGVDGPQISVATEGVEAMFTATELHNLWPQASLHTQWPGRNGSVGDAIFDEFYASMVPLLSTNVESATKNQNALVSLVDKIGPVNLLTHSQSGLFGWSLADSRPHLIKSLVALEPGGPPFSGDALTPNSTSRLWGLTDIPLNYSPPLPDGSPEALNRDKIVVNDPKKDGYTCYAQSPPIRNLPNLSQVPILVVTSESSWHVISDGCIVRYLKEAGVKDVEYVKLQDAGFRGNGHMFFMEKNSIEIVEAVVGPWIERTQKHAHEAGSG